MADCSFLGELSQPKRLLRNNVLQSYMMSFCHEDAPFVHKGYNFGLYLYSYPDTNAFVCSVHTWIFLLEVQHFIYKNSLSIKTNMC